MFSLAPLNGRNSEFGGFSIGYVIGGKPHTKSVCFEINI